jgi:hypothetical protein
MVRAPNIGLPKVARKRMADGSEAQRLPSLFAKESIVYVLKARELTAEIAEDAEINRTEPLVDLCVLCKSIPKQAS